MKKEALRASCVVPSTPHAVYCAWLDGAQHSAFTGGSKAVINADVGTTFTAWDGYIQGKNIQLDLGRRIIQSWRTTEFPKGAPDSRLEIHFEPVFDGTRVTILHSDIPEGQGEKYRAGWNDKYFQPMRAYFGKMAIKADRASMARMQQRASEPPATGEDTEPEAPETPLAKLKKRAIEAKPPKVVAVVKTKVAPTPAPAPKTSKIAKPVSPAKASPPAKAAKQPTPAPAKPAKPAPTKPSKAAKPAPKPSVAAKSGKPAPKKPAKAAKPAPKKSPASKPAKKKKK